MKKILSSALSVALFAAAVGTPLYAQTLKKYGAGAVSQSATKPTVTMRAQAKPLIEPKNNARLYSLKPRTAQSSLFIPKASAGKVISKPGARTRSMASGQLPTIYGSVIYSNNREKDHGLYELPKSGGKTTLLFAGPVASGGGICIDGVYHASDSYSDWGTLMTYYTSYDMETGAVLGENSYSSPDLSGSYALDPTTGSAYGLTYTEDGEGHQLSSMSFTNNELFSTAIAPVEGNWNSIAFDGQGQLYGISYTGEMEGYQFVTYKAYLNKIDKATGAVTQVAEITGAPAPQYTSSCCIDPKTNIMYWNVCPSDGLTYMYEVDLSTGQAQLLYQLEDGDEIMGMFIPAPAAEDGAPAECENVTLNFSGSSLSGKVSLKAPSTLFDGTAASGELTINVLAAGHSFGQRWLSGS